MRKRLKYDKNQRYSWKDQQKIEGKNHKEMLYEYYF